MANRTLRQNGGSFLIAVPPTYIEDLKLEAGDKIRIRCEGNTKLILEKICNVSLAVSGVLVVGAGIETVWFFLVG